MTTETDIESVKRVAEKINIYRLDRGTSNMGYFSSIVTAVQEYFRTHHLVPSPDVILATLTPVGGRSPSRTTVVKVLSSPGFEKSMEMRGIPLAGPTNGLTPAQSLLITALTNPTDRRPLSGKLKTAGISYHVYNNWLKQPLFYAAMTRQAEGLLREHTGDVLVQLTQKAVSGDLRAIQFYLEVNGRHDPAGGTKVDAQAMMAQVLEVISRRVTDTGVLAAIAADFELIASGQSLGAAAAGANGPLDSNRSESNGVVPGFLVDPSATPNQPRPLPKVAADPQDAAREWLELNGAVFNEAPVGDISPVGDTFAPLEEM